MYVGFIRNQSRIRSINFDQTNYSYLGSDNHLLVTGGYRFARLTDTHNSIYFGISNTH
ncbi:hypothetical protein LEP1GSC199_2801 [Leptospira vanthielii serovar Holland str. Waz Holland = ATCC 700522]|uniref:Uncharacterized protein n=1 Tax=Leptospira vanthielii serovar Holland str. Waz Holland = ATCC 700522 TaxID=1218591 RepID=N1W481_9LEPT|nr:hypothetical protein LEP1GSC199_2801 [Leptospira vanthielii serovar Holland str. Waz Holland = ATCC 700522]